LLLKSACMTASMFVANTNRFQLLHNLYFGQHWQVWDALKQISTTKPDVGSNCNFKISVSGLNLSMWLPEVILSYWHKHNHPFHTTSAKQGIAVANWTKFYQTLHTKYFFIDISCIITKQQIKCMCNEDNINFSQCQTDKKYYTLQHTYIIYTKNNTITKRSSTWQHEAHWTIVIRTETS